MLPDLERKDEQMEYKPFVVDFYSHWNGIFNEYDSREFDTLEEAEAFAAKQYDPKIFKRVPSPSYMNSRWSFDRIA